MILMLLALLAFLLAALPAILFWSNLRAYQPPSPVPMDGTLPRVSVLIPARNEERSIQAAIEAALASENVEVEVIVLDDHSEDATAHIVSQFTASDPRVRLISASELPDGWCGKQYACWTLAQHATCDLLLFLDADVRLFPKGLARLAAFLEQANADLISGIPNQETITTLEWLVIPLIHFVLLGFLPLRRMRVSCNPAYGAGCGQLFLARRSSYEKADGHSAISKTLHDGLKLPRAFRAKGFKTDLCDATEVAQCRMYRTGGELWQGLAKNAGEGLGEPRLIVPSTFLLLMGQVSPIVLFCLSIRLAPAAAFPAVAALLCSYYPRLAGVARFGQPLRSALLHPIGVSILVAIQWYAFIGLVLGRRRVWKGRRYRPSYTG